MPKLWSSDWDESAQACLKHGHPQLPCNACLEEKNPNISVTLDAMDREWLRWDAPREIPPGSMKDLFPADQAWLVERLQ